MFDIGFSELFLICIIILVVIGPEKLPTIARVLGKLAGRAQRYVGTLKAEAERELQLEKLQELQKEMTEHIHQSPNPPPTTKE